MAQTIHHPHLAAEELLPHYPSHLHIDLLSRLQKGGNGSRLIRTLLDALREKGSPGVHLGVGIRNQNAIGFYRHVGFQELVREEWGYVFGMPLKSQAG
jgi:ribosomal protein S18 acetylase RimI-like enzyme